MSPQIETLPAWSRDDDLIAALRILLALSALLIIYIDPVEPEHYVALTHATCLTDKNREGEFSTPGTLCHLLSCL